MKAYLDIVKNVLENGYEKYPVRYNHNSGEWEPVDGGVKTIALPNVLFTHDMSEGFPLLTTKKMAWRSIRVELEGFIKGITDKRWFQERGCTIWNEFSLVDSRASKLEWENRKIYQEKSNDLGPIYGANWRNFNGSYTTKPNANIPYQPLKKSIDNKIYNHPKYGDYIIIEKLSNKSRIQFIDTGYSYFVRTCNLNRNQVKDPYAKIHYGVACLGKPNRDLDYFDVAYRTWTNMLKRCYDPRDKDYHNYGARGVHVCNDWLVFEFFLEDFSKIPNFHLKQQDPSYTLDKDIKGNGLRYDLDSCIWASKEQQHSYRSTSILFDAIDPNGVIYYSQTNLNKFCKDRNLDSADANKRLNGKYPYKVKGWDFINKRQLMDKSIYQGTDQLKNIVDTLKTNPSDRRMVCSAWNPNQIAHMALPPCHYVWNVTVIGGKVHLFWAQRSCDLMLGVPFNIASYALLLELLAKEAGLPAGNLSGMLVDCHIYENQLEGAKEQITREPYPLPKIEVLDRDGKFDIFDWEYNDVKLHDYRHHDRIKFGEVIV